MGSTQMPRAALITGAGRRIGRAIALALARAGYSVVLHAHRSRAEAEKLAAEIAAAGGRAAVVLADLTDADAVRGLIPAAAAFGPLTLLVNNASQFDEDEIGSLERGRFECTLAVNLTASVHSKRPRSRLPISSSSNWLALLTKSVSGPNAAAAGISPRTASASVRSASTTAARPPAAAISAASFSASARERCACSTTL